MPSEISLLDLIFRASPIVKVIMLLLLAASIYSWTIIFQKWKFLKQVGNDVQGFERRFWSGLELDQLYQNISRRNHKQTLLEQIFGGGYQEFLHLYEHAQLPIDSGLESAQRSMRATLNRQLSMLEERLPVLATIGSTSPYVGLFGTVWGIMGAFQSLGTTQHATLAMVAPGIAEALVATAMGLFAAIPAVIAYNRFSTQVENQIGRCESFIDELMGLLERQAHLQRDSRKPNAQTDAD